ncbi:MAG: 16S rRNA (uracil(1498)-N(3))-methyltransferase [Bacteroidota bacterium]
MHLFYTPDITSNTYTLTQEESHHCIKVLRLKPGDIIHLVDGKGGLYKAEITVIDHKKCRIKVIDAQKENCKKDFYLHIAVAPTKNISRFEWFLEKATEIGINEITPIICTHSERNVLKTDRLNKIIIAAMKQSLKTYLPKLNIAVRYNDFIGLNFTGQKFIATCNAFQIDPLINRVGEMLHESYKKGNNALILIGPEGDFSQSEMEIAVKNGFQPVSFGRNRLRTETAALVACHTINLMNE